MNAQGIKEKEVSLITLVADNEGTVLLLPAICGADVGPWDAGSRPMYGPAGSNVT